jgi:hypothetical protein
VCIFNDKLRLANPAEAHEGYATSRLGASLVDLVENISTVDEIGIAGEGDGRERLQRRFRSFWKGQRGNPCLERRGP